MAPPTWRQNPRRRPSSVLAAWCAFTGALHGGAPGPTLDMLDAAEAVADLEPWLEAKLRSGERLMGFGHRVFHGNDPRAEAMRRSMQAMGPDAGRLAFADRLEKAVAVAIERVKPGRMLPPSVCTFRPNASLILILLNLERSLKLHRRQEPPGENHHPANPAAYDLR